MHHDTREAQYPTATSLAHVCQPHVISALRREPLHDGEARRARRRAPVEPRRGSGDERRHERRELVGRAQRSSEGEAVREALDLRQMLAQIVGLFETGYAATGMGLFQYDRGHLSHQGMAVRLADASGEV